MRISDWSSDVCSSDLNRCLSEQRRQRPDCQRLHARSAHHRVQHRQEILGPLSTGGTPWADASLAPGQASAQLFADRWTSGMLSRALSLRETLAAVRFLPRPRAAAHFPLSQEETMMTDRSEK